MVADQNHATLGRDHKPVASSEAGGVQKATFEVSKQDDDWLIRFSGDWTIRSINETDKKLSKLDLAGCQSLQVDSSAATALDTAGAWMIERLRLGAEKQSIPFQHHDSDDRRVEFVRVIALKNEAAPPAQSKVGNFVSRTFESIGHSSVAAWHDIITACYLVGASVRGPQMKAGRRGGIRMTSIVHHLDQMGLRAIPVIAVMSFLIGAIIAQQGAYQLRFYGEELLTVNLVGILHFREIGVLLTAVMVAGRSGSAITAELGTMKMREEIDALTVIGLNPIGVLIFPRLVALIIALPILVLLSDVAGILGAIVVSDIYVDITPGQFLMTLQSGVELKHLFVGFIKAPVMAIIIGLSAAVEGLKVEGSAESLGRRTTSAVVRAIFAVIVVDGLFAMFFVAIGY